MDGQHRQVLLDEDLGWPTGLTLDYLNGNRIYWCDSKENIIESMRPDGTDRKIVMSGGWTSDIYKLYKVFLGMSFSSIFILFLPFQIIIHTGLICRYWKPLQSGCV